MQLRGGGGMAPIPGGERDSQAREREKERYFLPISPGGWGSGVEGQRGEKQQLSDFITSGSF